MIRLWTFFYSEGDDLLQSVDEIREHVPKHIPYFVLGRRQSDLNDFYTSFDDAMICAPAMPVCRSVRAGIGLQSPVCFIYTSGTTGMWYILFQFMV